MSNTALSSLFLSSWLLVGHAERRLRREESSPPLLSVNCQCLTLQTQRSGWKDWEYFRTEKSRFKEKHETICKYLKGYHLGDRIGLFCTTMENYSRIWVRHRQRTYKIKMTNTVSWEMGILYHNRIYVTWVYTFVKTQVSLCISMCINFTTKMVNLSLLSPPFLQVRDATGQRYRKNGQC